MVTALWQITTSGQSTAIGADYRLWVDHGLECASATVGDRCTPILYGWSEDIRPKMQVVVPGVPVPILPRMAAGVSRIVVRRGRPEHRFALGWRRCPRSSWRAEGRRPVSVELGQVQDGAVGHWAV